MELFEFLMILLSLIVGLGLAEILTGFGKILREGRQGEMSWLHSTVALAIFFGLLQTFWESWGLRGIEQWTFPAMLMMLGSPILLLTITHIIFPSKMRHANLEEYYFANPTLPRRLAAGTIAIGTLFRPLAFGAPRFVWDNASGLPTLLIAIALASSKNRTVHRVLVPTVALLIILDTLFISYQIS